MHFGSARAVARLTLSERQLVGIALSLALRALAPAGRTGHNQLENISALARERGRRALWPNAPPFGRRRSGLAATGNPIVLVVETWRRLSVSVEAGCVGPGAAWPGVAFAPKRSSAGSRVVSSSLSCPHQWRFSSRAPGWTMPPATANPCAFHCSA